MFEVEILGYNFICKSECQKVHFLTVRFFSLLIDFSTTIEKCDLAVVPVVLVFEAANALFVIWILGLRPE
jgi:hypothetical protein